MSTALAVAASPQARAESFWGVALAAPAMLLILALMLGPIAALIGLSVTDYRLGAVAVKLVGLGNYEAMLGDPVARRSLANTFRYVAIVLPLSVFGALLVAILMHARMRTRSLYEIVYFLPLTSTLIAMATVWQFMLHPNLGALAALADALGLSRPDFLNDPDLAIWAIASSASGS